MSFTKAELRDLYRIRSKRYDFTANLYYLIGFREWAYREKAVRQLRLSPGDTVVEIGCGTGLNFDLIQQAIGPTGQLIGVDMTESMLERARLRVEQHQWSNVELIQTDAATFDFPPDVNGILSTFALTLVPEFDAVIRTGSEALENGGRWVVADLKLPGGRLAWLTRILLPLFRPFGVTIDLADRHPWDSIDACLSEFRFDESYFGYVYVASGTKAVSDHGGESLHLS